MQCKGETNETNDIMSITMQSILTSYSIHVVGRIGCHGDDDDVLVLANNNVLSSE